MNAVRIYVKGRNRASLFNKLEKAGVRVEKCKFLSDNELILFVKSSDKEKVFAISADMWYTKLIKESFTKRIGQAIVANVFTVAAVLLVAVGMLLSAGVVFSVDVSAFPDNVGREILKEVEGIGVKKFSIVTDEKIKEAEKIIRHSVKGIKSVSVKKSANKLVIYGIYETPTIDSTVPDKLCSLYTGVIKEIVVYKGEQKKFEGDYVKAGETLAENGVIATYVIESEITFEFTGDGSESFKEDSERAALLLAGGNGEAVNGILTKISENTFSYNVTVKRLFCYPGGSD